MLGSSATKKILLPEPTTFWWLSPACKAELMRAVRQ